MGKVLVSGICPLPFEQVPMNWGPGIRTWQFCRALSEAGNEVTLLALADPRLYSPDQMRAEERLRGVRIHRLAASRFMDPTTVRRYCRQSGAETVVGATALGSFALARSAPEVPFWADQFGHAMAEAQAKAATEGHDRALSEGWKVIHPVLSCADRISTVSRRQRYAVIGELGAVGRLNRATCGHDLVAVVPCAAAEASQAATGPVLRGSKLAPDDFIVLWSGSYNVWSDVETLVEGVEKAMSRSPRVRFVSIGGAVEGHDVSTYARMQELVAASSFRDWFHLEGWVDTSLVPSYQAEANLAILAEKPIYEGLLGSKNRVLEWLGLGLPVAVNPIGDLGDYLATDERALVFDSGDPSGLAESIIWALENPDKLALMALRAREAASEDFSLAATTAPLSAWVAEPVRAPDRSGAVWTTSPLDYAKGRQRLAVRLQSVPAIRRSRILRSMWRALTSGS